MYLDSIQMHTHVCTWTHTNVGGKNVYWELTDSKLFLSIKLQNQKTIQAEELLRSSCLPLKESVWGVWYSPVPSIWPPLMKNTVGFAQAKGLSRVRSISMFNMRTLFVMLHPISSPWFLRGIISSLSTDSCTVPCFHVKDMDGAVEMVLIPSLTSRKFQDICVAQHLLLNLVIWLYFIFIIV